MAATIFDQFRRFTTDAYGLERLLRFLQAAVQILLSLIASSTTASDFATNIFNDRELQRPLKELSGRLGLVRRFFRFFRFLDAFTNSYKVFASLNQAAALKDAKEKASTKFLESTLDGLTGTFNGLYLLLEAITLADALGIPELAILGPKLEFELKIESQRCWFLALAAGALACLLRLSKLQDSKTSKAAVNGTSAKGAGIAKEEALKAQTAEQASNAIMHQWRLKRKMAACLLDMALPGSIIGWIPISSGAVAGVMLVTSVLTGMDVWERCGKEVGRA